MNPWVNKSLSFVSLLAPALCHDNESPVVVRPCLRLILSFRSRWLGTSRRQTTPEVPLITSPGRLKTLIVSIRPLIRKLARGLRPVLVKIIHEKNSV
jgi:hypothetical protein